MHHWHILRRVRMVLDWLSWWASISILWRFCHYVMLLLIEVESCIIASIRLINSYWAITNLLSPSQTIAYSTLHSKCRRLLGISGCCSIFLIWSITINRIVRRISPRALSILSDLTSSVRSPSNYHDLFRLIFDLNRTHSLNQILFMKRNLVAVPFCIGEIFIVIFSSLPCRWRDNGRIIVQRISRWFYSWLIIWVLSRLLIICLRSTGILVSF